MSTATRTFPKVIEEPGRDGQKIRRIHIGSHLNGFAHITNHASLTLGRVTDVEGRWVDMSDDNLDSFFAVDLKRRDEDETAQVTGYIDTLEQAQALLFLAVEAVKHLSE